MCFVCVMQEDVGAAAGTCGAACSRCLWRAPQPRPPAHSAAAAAAQRQPRQLQPQAQVRCFGQAACAFPHCSLHVVHDHKAQSLAAQNCAGRAAAATAAQRQPGQLQPQAKVRPSLWLTRLCVGLSVCLSFGCPTARNCNTATTRCVAPAAGHRPSVPNPQSVYSCRGYQGQP